jgi:CRISPR-associated endonuclease/helicase Cas3
MNYLAHSAAVAHGVPQQSYKDHIENVVCRAANNAEGAACFSLKYGDLLKSAVRQAAEYHDLGKLDDFNQAVLKTNRGKMLNHVDAGVAQLMKDARGDSKLLAAIVVYSHHIGLPAWADEVARGSGMILRDTELTPDGDPLVEYTNSHLNDYVVRHIDIGLEFTRSSILNPKLTLNPLLWRMTLSCLVDADHSDTARHYRNPVPNKSQISLDPIRRLRLLDAYVAGLGGDANNERIRLRSTVYHACRSADCSKSFFACDSPVGTGKTTAVIAHLLNAAAAKKLRRIFVVLPFTNIIDQSVNVYRKSLVDLGESPDDVVVAHHHKASFEDAASRQYSFLWHAPIVVTTAVQFFETLAARRPGSIRKLHQIAGSAIFIDEAHAALPTHLWPQAWKWLKDLEQDWGCHIVVGSGSMNRFWELPEFVDPPVGLPPLVTEALREFSADHERHRVSYRELAQPVDLESLTQLLKATKGPRLLIVNTVQSAAAIARHLSNEFGRDNVEHISTALTPQDRQTTLDLVRTRLRSPDDNDWILVATSCVEAGVDFSFRTGIRERCSLTSLLQTSGRVNRSNEYLGAEVWDIQIRHDHLLKAHPAFEDSGRVLGELFAENKVSPEYCTESLRREIRRKGMAKKKQDIEIAERNANFPIVEEVFRIIESDTVTAVVDGSLIRRLEAYATVTHSELQSASVQIWHNKEQEFGLERLEKVRGYEDLRKWVLPYDSFLGYMSGVLPLIDGGRSGFVI